MKIDQHYPPVDAPIETAADDLLERARLAHDLIRDILKIDARTGLVVGVMGPWGHGKSSFVNLITEDLEALPEIEVVDFNPWLFSGTHQLAEAFLAELAAQLEVNDKAKFGGVAKNIRDYADVLRPLAVLPVVGAWTDRVIDMAKELAASYHERNEQSVSDLRDKISAQLSALESPVVVVIDDIDRLTTEEIRDMFRLVRLTASFPNVIYLLSFDRERVESALEESGSAGRMYLEKIVQVGFDIPSTPATFLREKLLSDFDDVVRRNSEPRFNRERWPNVYAEIIEPLVHSVRDIDRLVAGSRFAVISLGHEIDIVDILALEAIRLFNPAFFEVIRRNRDFLTRLFGPTESVAQQRAEGEPKMREILASAAAGQRPADPDITGSFFGRILPAGSQYFMNRTQGSESLAYWRREHRVAHPDFLALYFERLAPAGMHALRLAETAIELFSDEAAFKSHMWNLPSEQLRATLDALELYEGEYPSAGISSVCVTLLGVVTRVPEQPGLLFSFDGSTAVARVILRILRSISDETARERAVEDVLSAAKLYSEKLLMLRVLGIGQEGGAGLASPEFLERSKSTVAYQIASSPPLFPSREWDLLRAYVFALDEGHSLDASAFDMDTVWALVLSARATNRTQAGDSPQVQVEEVLAWDLLLRVLGDQELIQRAAQRARAAGDNSRMVELVERYLAGWRHRDILDA
ncbi:KAP family P-loop domain protein [Promicromonospora xylanilytica]